MYSQAPEAGIASLLASRGRNGDSMLVHMAPEELSGLQQLAVAHGGTLTLNPVTGLYEASFLKKLLPAIIGAVLPSVPGLGKLASSIGGFFGASGAAASTLGTGLLVGGATALIEGDLKKGLSAGLGAYSGANLAQSLQAAAAAPPVSSAEEVAKANQAVEAAKQTVGAEPVINPTAPSDLITPDVASGMGGSFTTPSPWGGAQFDAAGDLILPEALRQPSAISGLSGIAQGAQNLFTNPNARSAFIGGLGGGFESPIGQNLSRYATLTGVMDAFTPEMEMPKSGAVGEDYIYMPGQPNPRYGTGRNEPYFLPGGYYKRTPQGLVPYNPFAMAPGYADGGVVDPEDAMMVNTGADPMYDITGQYTAPNYNATAVTPATTTPVAATAAPQNPYDVQRQRYETMLAAPPPPAPDTSAVTNYIANLNRRAQNPLVYPYPGAGSGTGGAGGTGNTGARCGPGFIYDANLQRCVPISDANEPGGPGAGDGSGGTGRAGGERGPGGGVSSGAGGGGFTGGGRGGAGTGADLGSIFGGAKTPGEIATRALNYLEATGGITGTVLGLTREVWKQIQEGKLDLREMLRRTALGFVPDFIEEMFKDKDKDKEEEEEQEELEPPLTAGRGGGEGYGGGISGGGIGGGWGMYGIGGGGGGGAGKITIEDPITGEQIKNVARGGHIKSMQTGGLSAPPNPYGAAVGEGYNFGFAAGGVPEYQAGGKLLNGPGDGMSDDIPAVIRGEGVQRAALADGEFVVPADVVSHLGNGSTNAGAKKLYQMMAKVRQARTGKNSQAPAVNTQKYLPA